jgi:hypothetical protein
MKKPNWWPHDELPETNHDLTKRVADLENRFTNLWLTVGDYVGRLKSLELHEQWRGEYDMREMELYHKAKIKAWMNEEETLSKPKRKQKKK